MTTMNLFVSLNQVSVEEGGRRKPLANINTKIATPRSATMAATMLRALADRIEGELGTTLTDREAEAE